jgi:hypothetical protein
VCDARARGHDGRELCSCENEQRHVSYRDDGCGAAAARHEKREFTDDFAAADAGNRSVVNVYASGSVRDDEALARNLVLPAEHPSARDAYFRVEVIDPA